MKSETYHFKIGAFKCIAVSDGIFKYAPPTFPPPAKFLFGNVSRDDLEKTLGKHNLHPESWTEWLSPYICLLVNTGEHLVLVDTGANGSIVVSIVILPFLAAYLVFMGES